MRKVVLCLALSLGMAAAAMAQVKIGVHASGIMGGAKFKVEEEDIDSKFRLSWRAGLVAEISLGEQFSFVPQLNILSKGPKIETEYTDEYEGVVLTSEVVGKAKFTYVELPLNFAFKSKNFMVGVGPSFSMGIGGEIDFTETIKEGDEVIEEHSFKQKVKFDGDDNADDDDSHLKAFELGANLLLAYKFDNFFIQANANLGLSNIATGEGGSLKNHYFGVGIGYFFNKRSK